jgi:lysyl-tRNA synthetase class 2
MSQPAAQRRRNGTSPLADRVHRGGAAAAVWYLRIVATLNLLGAVSVSLRENMRHHGSGDFYTPYLLTAGLASGAFALFMAVMMRRRKRAAWILNTVVVTLFLLLISVAMAASPDVRHHWFNWLSAGITLAFLLALLLGRSEFRGKGDRSNPWLALTAFFGGGAAAMLLGTGLVTWTNAIPGSSIGDRAHYVLLRGISLGQSSSALPDIDTPGWVDVSLNVLGVLVFLLVLYALFRAPRGKEYLGAADEARLRGLLDGHGEQDSLGYFALRRDKSVLFSPSGKAAIAYRVVGGVCLASGDPIGDVEAWPGAIEAWLEQARDHAWIPAVMGASEAGGTIYARHGLDALELGDEAIVHTAEFTLDGRAMRGVRQAHKRVQRAGYTVRVRRHEDIPDGEMAHLLTRADAWRDGQTERGFSMALGRLGDSADGRCVMAECHDATGELRALLSFVPWGCHGLSLDLMRRDRDADNGLLEYMIIELIGHAKDLDVQRLSLNFAMFRAVFERGSRLGAGPFLRAWRSTLLFFSRWWQIESLYRANAKYRPTWEPRYLLFEHSRDLVRIGLASARAEGFITAPRLLRRAG